MGANTQCCPALSWADLTLHFLICSILETPIIEKCLLNYAKAAKGRKCPGLPVLRRNLVLSVEGKNRSNLVLEISGDLTNLKATEH